jgi:hypothetical protein
MAQAATPPLGLAQRDLEEPNGVRFAKHPHAKGLCRDGGLPCKRNLLV